MDRRSEVTNEALAEEVKRLDQKKKGNSDTPAASSSQAAASASHELRETPIEFDSHVGIVSSQR